MNPLARKYRVRLTLTEPMLGTVPKSEKVFRDYLSDLAQKRKTELGPVDADALIEEEVETLGTREERGWTGFHVGEDGVPFLYDYQIKGFLKEAANVLKDMPDVKIKALKSKIDNYAYVFPRRIPLTAIEPEPLERPLRALTMQGPRVSLVRSDVIAAGAVIVFEIHVLPFAGLTAELIETLLAFGEYKGLGQWRGGSYGRFTYELTPV